jgi:drug/metabolite transporter (DMT)-like permease
MRWLLAAMILLPFAWRGIVADWPALRQRAGAMAFLGLLGGAGFSFTQYYALRHTSVVNVGIMNSIGPAFIILAGIAIFRDRVRLPQIVGVTVSLAGVLVIILRGDPAVLANLGFNVGDLIAVVNMGIFAVYSACLRLRPNIGGLTFMTAMSLLAALGSVPVMVIELMTGEVIRPSGATIFAVIYTGLFTSVIAYLAWNAGVAKLGPQRAGAFLHLVPLFGALLSLLLLGEAPQPYHGIGFLLIVAGVTLAARPTLR